MTTAVQRRQSRSATARFRCTLRFAVRSSWAGLHLSAKWLIVQVRKEHPSWGAPKTRKKTKLRRLGIGLPAIGTVHAVLDRHGLVTRSRRHPHYRAEGTGLSRPDHPKDLWCADYKGEFMLADWRYCYPFVTLLLFGTTLE